MPVNKADLIAIRPGCMADKSFIFATWLRGLRYGNDWFGMIDSECYFKAYQQVITTVLSSPNTTVKVACLKEDPDVILGYSVYASELLHFVFVKKSWRNIGIARSLFPEKVMVVTHLTSVGKSMLKKHPHIKFNPFSGST